MGVLTRTGVRKDVRDSEYFEKPHVRRNRQKSERHRRRFQEMVSLSLPADITVMMGDRRYGWVCCDNLLTSVQIRGKVQMVQAIRNRR